MGTLVGAIGQEAAERLACLLADEVWRLQPRWVDAVRARIEIALSEAPPDVRAQGAGADDLARRFLHHLARFWVEVVHVPRRIRPKGWSRWVGTGLDAETEQTVRGRRGAVVLASGQWGNPAVAALVLGMEGPPVHVVAAPLRWPVVRGWREGWRRAYGLRLVDPWEAATVLPAVLRGGGRVFLLADYPRRRGGVVARFLGRWGSFYPTVGLLCRRYDAHAAVVGAQRLEQPGRFELVGQVVHRVAAAGSESDPDAITLAGLHALERMIWRSPEQYLWAAPGAG